MNVIAVDVGTTSVRLAIIAFHGNQFQDVKILASHKKDIAYVQDGCKFEQSSVEIWAAICECCRKSLKESNISTSSIKSISFSATCSLVIVSDAKTSAYNNDIIMWMDHRAIEEANEITESKDRVLKQFGGVCSPEFSLAKLVWLKKHARQRFDSAIGLFELPDWLVYKCLNNDLKCSPRSLDCIVSKWGFDPLDKLNCLPVSQLLDSIQDKIGEINDRPGFPAGPLSQEAARELGIWSEGDREFPQVIVGLGMIDAHAGMVAMLSAQSAPIEGTLCSLAGTSSCHMFMSGELLLAHGIWGPYHGALFEGKTLYETGQSLTGKLIEIVIESHEEGKIQLEKGKSMYTIIQALNESLKNQYPSKGASNMDEQLLILPTFHGNRSPLANPRLKGGIYGLSAEGTKSLLDYYVATVESLAFEMKFIIERLETNFKRIIVSGGLTKNHFYMQTLANVLECNVKSMSFGEVDAMVMGSGLAASTAISEPNFINLFQAPIDEEGIKDFHYEQLETKTYEPEAIHLPSLNKRYKCYKEFVDFSVRVDKIMNERETVAIKTNRP